MDPDERTGALDWIRNHDGLDNHASPALVAAIARLKDLPNERAGILDEACNEYRRLVKSDEDRAARYLLWNPEWESTYVDTLIRDGRSHAQSARCLSSALQGLVGKRLLEVGCGYGRMAVELCGLGANVTATDVERDYIRLARIVAAGLGQWGSDRLRFQEAAAEDLPFESASFDVVWSDQTIEHVENVKRSLKEMARVLRPGGALFVRCPNYLSLKMREPHFDCTWPPYLPRSAYCYLFRRNYLQRARGISADRSEPSALARSASIDATKEIDAMNFVKPWQVARVFRDIEGLSWGFVRSPYVPSVSPLKRPGKWLWYQLGLDVPASRVDLRSRDKGRHRGFSLAQALPPSLKPSASGCAIPPLG